MQKNKTNPTNIKLSNLIKVSDKLSQGCIIVTVLTAILCVIKIFSTIELRYYYELDGIVYRILIWDVALSLLIIAIEIFVCIITSNLSTLADLVLKNSNPADPLINAQPSSNQWQCPDCKKINESYVGTCGCGKTKPN